MNFVLDARAACYFRRVAELGVAFLSRLPADLRGTPSDELEPELQALVSRARSEVPGVALDPIEFVAYVAERVTFDARGRPVLASLHAGDLWIAFGCVTGARDAIGAFEARYAAEIAGALRRSFEPALAEDAELRLREKLMLVADDGTPRLASYAGRGGLGPWLRAAAVRTAIDLMRARKEVPADPGALGELGGQIDPLLASLKQRYRDEFRIAFEAAAQTLTPRERTLLRYRFFDDLSIDEIGTLYRVHRATVARWIAAIRESLFEVTRTRLMAQLSITDSEVDSVLRLIDSQLDVSIGALVR
jgi:RNA polymerase sigma-70 factor (ECF subfamily)